MKKKTCATSVKKPIATATSKPGNASKSTAASKGKAMVDSQEEDVHEDQGSSGSVKVEEEQEKEEEGRNNEEEDEKEDSVVGRYAKERERKSKAEAESRKVNAAGSSAVKSPATAQQQVLAPAPYNLADKSTWTRRKVCAVKKTHFRTRIIEEKFQEKSATNSWPSPTVPASPAAASEVAAGSAAGTANAAGSGDSDVVVTSVKEGKRTRGTGGSRKSARLDASVGK